MKRWFTLLLTSFVLLHSAAYSTPIRNIKIMGLQKASRIAPAPETANTHYYIQVAAFGNINNAKRSRQALAHASPYPVKLVPTRGLHTVLIGPIPSRHAVLALSYRLLNKPLPAKLQRANHLTIRKNFISDCDKRTRRSVPSDTTYIA